MEWHGDETKLGQLCQLFALASSPDNSIQQQVIQTLNHFSQMPDFMLYLVTVFAKLPGQEEIVRQRAGLQLKTNIIRTSNDGSMTPAVAEYIQSVTLTAVRDPSRVIRHTAGTIITTFVQKAGVVSCGPILERLAEYLGDSNPDIVEGSFNALNKICEDGVATLKQFWEAPEHTQPFVSWCTDRLLPRVFEYAQPSAPLHARQNAIECLNHFALNYVFNDSKYATLQPFGQKYMEVLGILATDADVSVLRDVCKGFCCVIENNWSCLDVNTCQVVLQYMLKASRHPEYVVRLEALEVWTPCTSYPMLREMVRPMLPELLPVLLANMVYSSADYMGMEQSQIDDDNAAQPDQLQDIRPRFHKEQGEEADDDDGGQTGGGGAWGAEWTARKAAASSLDHMANAYRQEILPVVLPLIQQKLENDSWEVQESGVLAFGAIAFGCMGSLVQFLPRVLELLLKLIHAPKPLLRSISCWCASRYSQWICSIHNPTHEENLRSVLAALLQRVLDKNKRVQEAACSAFATLEEEARDQLVPYLDEIVETLVRAFQYYQAKNLLILYDAVGTLADAVGAALNSPKYVQVLMPPLVQKFEEIAQPAPSSLIIALFECLSALAHNLGPSFMPIVPQIVRRCGQLVLDGARAAQMWQQNPNEFEKPDREVMAASLDLLAGTVEGLEERVCEVLAQQNFITMVPEVLKDTSLQVKQSAFALVGDCAKYCIDYLVPVLHEILPLCAKSLTENTSATVSNNASWAIGEICVKVGPDFMAPYLEVLVPALTRVLARQQPQQMVMQNVCITLGRLGLVCGNHMGKSFPSFIRMWCTVMEKTRLDLEKINAFQGLCNMIKANPSAGLTCVPELVGAIASFYPAPASLEPSFREILTSYRQQLGPTWSMLYAQFPPDTQGKLSHMYGLGPG